jgi:signal peptidase
MDMTRARRVTRWAFEALLAALILGTVALVGLAHLVPASGHPVLIIRSGSMTPSIPVGAAVVLDPAPLRDVRAGDIVAMRLDSGAIFTHRVTRLVSLQRVAYVETKGDANSTVDPALTPVDHVIGRVSLTLPLAGFLMAGLAAPAGYATVLLACLTLFAALWLLDADEAIVPDPAFSGLATPSRRRLLPWAW